MSWIQITAATLVGAHGVGHVLGWGPALGLTWEPRPDLSSWLTGGTAARVLAAALFALPSIGFVATAVGLCTGSPWVRPVAVASAITSLLASAAFPRVLPPGSLAGSLLVNVAVLVVLGILAWR